jgi:hypothetical protein
LNTVLNTINNEFDHQCLDEAVRLLNAHPIGQSTEDHLPGHQYLILGLPVTKFLVDQDWAIWFIVRRWVSDTDMPGALVADEMGLGKTFTLVAAVMHSKLVTEKVVMGLPLSILWENTLKEWVHLIQNDFPRSIGDEREWYPLQRQSSVVHRLSEIPSTPLPGHPVLTSAVELILVVTMPGVAETLKSLIYQMTHGTDFKLMNLMHAENVHLTHEDLNTSIDEPEDRWNIHLLPYDTLTWSAKLPSNGRLSHYSWSYGIFDKSHRYKTEISVGCRFVMNARIEFKLQVAATPGFHSLYDWCFQTMWLFSGAPEDSEDDCDGKAWRQGTVFHSNECHSCHPD